MTPVTNQELNRNSEITLKIPSNSNISSVGWLILIIGILITKHGRIANDISPESWFCSSALRINKSFRPAEKWPNEYKLLLFIEA